MKTTFKKKFLLIITALSAIIVAIFTTSPTVFAEDFQGRTSGCQGFLGLTSWDCNVTITDQDSLVSGIWVIAANVAIDITVVATYLVIGYIIYGGYLYTMSGGDPNKVATGKKTLSQAFIGLTIVMLANIILNTIRIALSANFTGGCDIIDGSGEVVKCDAATDPGTLVVTLIHWVTGVAGVVSAIFVVYGGISYATSSGDPNKVKKAKDMILYALIGLAIVALAEVITAFVSQTIRDNSKTSLIQTEELYEKKNIN